jgi:hypothetical protein
MSGTAAIRAGRWRVWLPEGGGAAAAAAWLAAVDGLARGGPPLHGSKHADTYRLARPEGDAYVKVYRRYRRATALKDLVRPSKARRVLAASRRLAAAGFRVPAVLAAAEERRGPVVRRAWVATAALAGEPVAARLAALARAGRLGAKRALLAAVGRETGRLHAAGFVAGDLVAPNVWAVGAAEERASRVAFLDHDRTAAGRGPAPWRRARRNLVQLNRLVLPAVTATDRLRVYRAYAVARGWPWARARRRLAWIVAKTIERRRLLDRVALDPGAAVSFRELMRADGPFAARPARGALGAARAGGRPR